MSVDDGPAFDDSLDMADGGLTLNIDAALAKRLKSAAEAAGETVDDYARHALEVFAEASPDWDEIDKIADEAIAKGDDVPWEEVKEWMQKWDGKTKVPPPRR